MREELIDLLVGELPERESEALRARIEADPALQREFAELSRVFSVMSRGEVIEPSSEGRDLLMAEARRIARPSIRKRVGALADLVRFRFQRSLAFRVVCASLLVHFVVMGVLYQMHVQGRADDPTPLVIGKEGDAQPHAPPKAFRSNLAMRRLPHGVRLRAYGVEGQESLIRCGLEALRGLQEPDGSFGDLAETSRSVLALLAEGDCSAHDTPHGRAIGAAIHYIMGEVRSGRVHGHALGALVEDYTLSYEFLSEEDRVDYVGLIRTLILAVDSDPASLEGCALAKLAGFDLSSGNLDLGTAGYLVSGNPIALTDLPPTRISATVVLARGQAAPNPERILAWVRPLFERASGQLTAGDLAEALLTLQAPYRL